MLTDSASPSHRDENFSIKPETACDGQGGQHKTKKCSRSVHWVVSQPPHKGDKKSNESMLKANKCQLVTEVDDIKLKGVTDTLKGRAVIQPDFDMPEKRPNTNVFKFNKGKCKVLRLG
ncbi:hypothetical protein llap_2517 [Limosa lapponica baueri]|uniref:Uncharacterized protein n=1 Tax=Limosa lapponica baueri TaxID=1758121 RepID=A0A2I0UMC7_LIMLA|nr:hypothetical protein llap_2517 [Limosa lapponica baueri]